MLPTNVVSFMKKMVSNTEGMNANQFMSSSNSSGAGAIGRLRQTLQQAHESVSTRLQQNRSGGTLQPTDQPGIDTPGGTDNLQNVNQTPVEEKENQEVARPGSAGRCRVCVKAMKPDEYKRECTECGLQVCDDCASYSQNADGNEISWRCSVCRRRGVAIIARGVKPGIEQSEVLEGLGCETTIRRSPDTRRLQTGMNRADSETEVLLLAPKPSDVRRHSDVPLRDIAKFQAQAISAASSQHDLGLSVAMPTERAKSSNELMKKDKDKESGGGGISVNVTPSQESKSSSSNNPANNKDKSKASASNPKTNSMKRQRSYERGASEGALNLPTNARGRRASCDMRAIDSSSILNNNNIQPSVSDNKSGGGGGGGSGGAAPAPPPGLSEKDLQHLQKTHQQYLLQQQQQQQQQHQQQHHQQHPQQHQQNHQHQHQQQHQQYQQSQQSQQQQYQQPQQSQQPHHQQSQQPQYQQSQQSGQPQYQQSQQQHHQQTQNFQQSHERAKHPSDLSISGDTRRRSVQIYNTTTKQPPTPRSCASLDTEAIEMKQRQQQQQQHPNHQHEVKRQGSSQDGEAIKIVIDDVDSTAAAIDNNKAQANEAIEFRTRVVRLRRDPQDRGYQTRGFGLRVVGGCSVAGKPGNLRARVARVTPGSGADFAGIRRGDIVLTWNGIKLTNLTFEEVCKVMDASSDSAELTIAAIDSDQITVATVPEDEPSAEWEADGMGAGGGGEQYGPASPTRRQLPRLPTEGRIQLRLFHDEVHNTLEIAVVNIAFGNDDCTTIDLNDVIITLRTGEKIANTRWNQCVLFTKVSPEDLFDSWLILELARGPDFLGESHIDMGRVSLDDRPVWFPFSAKGSSSHRGSISQIINPGGNTPPGARELARRLRMRMAAGSQSQSEEQDDSSGQSSPCASSLLRPEVAWEVLGTLGPPSANLTSRSAPTSRRGSAQSDRAAIGLEVDDGRGSAPSTPALPRSLPPSRRGSFAVAVEQVISQTRRGSVAYQQQRVPDMFIRQLPEIPDGSGPDPAMLRNRRNSAWNPREVGFDRRSQFERTDSLRAIQNQPRRTSEVVQSFRDVVFEARNRARKAQEDESWRQHSPQWSDRQ